jgi:hypothetical protein
MPFGTNDEVVTINKPFGVNDEIVQSPVSRETKPKSYLKSAFSPVVEGAKNWWGGVKESVESANRAPTFPEYLLRTAGGAAGNLFNIPIEAAKTAYKYVPESIKENLSRDVVLQGAKKGVQDIGKNQTFADLVLGAQQIAKEHPRATENIVAGANLAGLGIGKAALKGGEYLGKEIAQASEPFIKKTAEKLIDFIPTPESKLNKAIEKGVSKGIKPTVIGKPSIGKLDKFYENANDAVKTIAENRDNISIVGRNGEVINKPETMEQFARAIDETKKTIYKKYHDMAIKSGDNNAQFDASNIVNRLEVIANDVSYEPSQRAYAQKMIDDVSELHGQSPEVIESRIAKLNKGLQPFYASRSSALDAEIDAGVASAMREELDNKITNAVGEGYQDLKNKYGSLKSIENEVAKRALVMARKAPKGFFDVADIFNAGETALGVVTGHPELILKAAVQHGGKEYIKHINNPDRFIKKMFNEAYKTVPSKSEPSLLDIVNGTIPKTSTSVKPIEENPFWNYPKTKKEAKLFQSYAPEQNVPAEHYTVGDIPALESPDEWQMRKATEAGYKTPEELGYDSAEILKEKQRLKSNLGFGTKRNVEIKPLQNLSVKKQVALSNFAENYNKSHGTQIHPDDIIAWLNGEDIPLTKFTGEIPKPSEGQIELGSGIQPKAMNMATRAGLGGTAGYVMSDPNATPEEKIRNAMLGAGGAAFLPLLTRMAGKELKGIPNAGLYGGEGATGFNDASRKFSMMTDKKPRFEIDDSKLKLKNLPQEKQGTKNTYLSDILDHDELYKQYPEFKNMMVKINIDPEMKKSGGSFVPGEDRKHLGLFNTEPEITIRARNNAEVKKSIIHEIQHAIQEKEGFAKGGSPQAPYEYGELKNLIQKEKEFLKKNADYLDLNNPYSGTKISDEDINKMAMRNINSPEGRYKAYQKLSGEVEARDAANRSDLQYYDRVMKQPLSSQNIPLSEMITRITNNNKSEMAPAGTESAALYTDALAKKEAEKIGLNYRGSMNKAPEYNVAKEQHYMNDDFGTGSSFVVHEGENVEQALDAHRRRFWGKDYDNKMNEMGMDELSSTPRILSTKELADAINANSEEYARKEFNNMIRNSSKKSKGMLGNQEGSIGGSFKPKVNNLGFYSNAEKAVGEINMPKAPASQWAKMLSPESGRGTKADEMKWIGLDDFLKEKGNASVSKQEIHDFIDQNKIQLEEIGMRNKTKFNEYQLPGGENYREVLLRLPKVKSDSRKIAEKKADELIKNGNMPEGARQSFIDSYEKQYREAPDLMQGKDYYKSPHWDEPNVLAHMRLNDRVDSEGKKVLFVEEIQSDWHQAGRKKGYETSPEEMNKAEQAYNDYYSKMREKYGVAQWRRKATQEELDQGNKLSDLAQQATNKYHDQVPAAPFSKTWHELAFKRILREASEEGYDKVAWTTGEQQAARYDLSKHIGKAIWNEDTKMLTAYDPAMEHKVIQVDIKDPSELENYIGKDAAQKLVDAKPDEDMDRTISGLDLKVGGEGMKGFYDKILPDYANKYGKKWGAKVNSDNINNVGNVHSMDITPAMRKSVMEEGQPIGATALPMLGLTGAASLGALAGGTYLQNYRNDKGQSFTDIIQNMIKNLGGR